MTFAACKRSGGEVLRQDTLTGKDSRYKFFWVGNDQGTSGVSVLLAEKWVNKVYDIKRVPDRIMLIKLLLEEAVLTVLSVYAPQTGLEESTKDAFYDSKLSSQNYQIKK